MNAERLYGQPGAEQLYCTPTEVWECEYDTGEEQPPGGWVVEEWTVAPTRSHMPNPDLIIDWIVEWIGENGMVDEYGYDAFDNAARVADVETMLDAWASRVAYRMADELVAEHRVTLVDGEPHLNCRPMYVKRADA